MRDINRNLWYRSPVLIEFDLPTDVIYHDVDKYIHDGSRNSLFEYGLLNTNRIINISTVYLITILS